ncbi:hypothetical protein ACFE04_014779 [Oxalis oulophora]
MNSHFCARALFINIIILVKQSASQTKEEVNLNLGELTASQAKEDTIIIFVGPNTGVSIKLETSLRFINKGNTFLKQPFVHTRRKEDKHRNKKWELLQVAPGKARVPNAAPGDASVPTCLELNFGGSNVATFSGPQEEAPAPAHPQVDNWNLDDWDELQRDYLLNDIAY